jgi:uncharacterized protein (TIGR02677 family)
VTELVSAALADGTIPPGAGGITVPVDALIPATMLIDRVEEVSYLHERNYDRYRRIVRFFLQEYEAQRDWLSTDAVYAAMTAQLGTGYTSEQLDQDLRQLVQWKNLDAMQETRHVLTLDEFVNRRTAYHIRPFAVEIELLVRAWEQGGVGSARLEASRLVRVVEALGTLFARLSPERSFAQMSREQITVVWAAWDLGHSEFEKLFKESNAYHHRLRDQRPADITNLTAFLAYKHVLLQALESFVEHLATHTDLVRSLLQQLSATGRDRILLDVLAWYGSEISPAADGPHTMSEVRAIVVRHWKQLVAWFEPGGGADVLYRATADAIDLVVRQNQRLIERHERGASRKHDLLRVADAFHACDSVNEAHVLGARVFGCPTVRHLSGDADVFTITDGATVWEQPTHDVELYPIRRGRRSEADAAVRVHRDAEMAAARAARAAERRRAQKAWARLFVDGRLDVAGLETDLETLVRLQDVIGACHAHANRTATTEDGTRIRLTAPAFGEPPTSVRTPCGVLILPRYQLELLDTRATLGGA